MKHLKLNKEILFQSIFHIIVFVFYSFDRNQPGVEAYKYAYFINYAMAALIVNYALLPIFYRRNNILAFVVLTGLCILGAALIEELILERIFFTGPRAENFRLIWALLDIIPVVAILVGVKLGWDAVVKQREVYKLEEVAKESELNFLKSQINPHFLFNNLNNLYAYALEESKKTPEIILELSGLLRYMLYECQEPEVSLSKEVDLVRNFVSLYELQIEDRGKVNFITRGMLGSYKIAPLIMIVFVENAFKHSQSSQSDDIEIDININMKNDGHLIFECSNTYRNTSNNEKLAKGIGLENVRKRLNLIYPNAHKLNIVEQDGIYRVHLTLDLLKDQN